MVYNPLFTQDYKTVITASASELAKLAGVLRTIYTDIKSALLPLKFSIRQKCAVLAQMAKKDNEDYFVELFVTQLPLPTKFINSQEYQEKLTKKKASSEALDIFNNFKKFINSTEDTAIVYKKNPVTLTCSKAQDKLSIKIETSLKRTGKFVSRLSKVSDIEDNSSLLEIFSNAFEYFLTSNYASFPLIYENDFSVNPVEPVTLKTQNGNYITIPRITQKDYDHVKSLIKTGKNKNKFIRVDDRTRTISFFDKDTKVQDYFYGRCVPITNRDIVTFIDKPMETLFETSGFGLAKHYNWTFHNSPVKSKYQKIFNSKSSLGYLTKEVKSSLEKEGIKDFSSVTLNTEDTTVGDIILAFPVEIKQFANELDDICERSFADGGVAPTTYIRFKGTINFLRKAIENPLEIKKQSVHNQIIFNSISPEDAPSIPNVNPEISLFPHQATAIAKLNVSDDNAIIDVSTGGGKTLVGIFDILNLMNQKKIKKPLVVVPGSLIPQWISQINFFTSNDKGVPQVNAFPITSELKASKNYQGGLESIIDNVPPNTIFITTYSFLGQYIENEENNSHIYTNVEWIQDVVNPDYLLLDESTHIKKQSTEINKACSLLGSTIQYKRIATGTLISNKAEDLIGQCCFLDPSIIGNESEFRNRYYIKGSKVPKENFAELCRNDLQNNVSYIMYRKKDWASLLPQVVYEPYFVDMSNAQRKIYRDMVRNILLEIENDPKLRKAWERLTSGNTEDYFSLSPQLLAKLAKLEQYLTAPELHKLTQYLDGEEYISPKIKKIDELIEKSISQNSKVIVAVHYKESAKHLMKYSKYSNSSVYYDAGHKDVLVRFVNDESCKVLFAVQQSLQEGLNLQCANRIIIADIDWTPGNAEQLEARINRPHLKWENGIAKNLNTNKVIYISHVLCNDSADVIKYIFQNYKRVFNSRIMEKCPVEDLMRPEFSDEGLVARFGDAIIGGQKNIDLIRSFETWQDKTIETARTENKKGFIQVKATSKLEGSKVVENLPWVSGMDLPYNESLGEIPLEEYAKQFDEFIQNPDINSIKSQILKKVARTDLGYGIIFNTTTSKKGNPGKVTIRQFIDGKVHAFSIYATIIAPEMTLGEAAKLQAKLNLRQQGKTALSAKDRVFLLEEELKKLYNIVPVKKTRLVHSNNEMDIPGYGKVIIPKGVPHYNNLLAFLKQLGAVVKRTGEPGNWSYVIQDLVSGVKSKPFKTTSDIDYKTWVELLLELRKKYNSRMLRADEIKIDIPKGNPSYDKLREIFGQYSVSLTKEKTGDEWKYYFSDRILHHQVYLPKGTTFRDKETYNYAWWIEQFLQYRKELDELYIEKGILSPKASANVPVDDTPIPNTKVKVNKKDKTVSLKEVDTPKKDKEYSTFDEDEDEEFNKSFDDDDEEIEFNDDGTEVNSPDTWEEDEDDTSLDEDDEKEFNKSFSKDDDDDNNKKSDESFDEDEDSFEDESFEDDESKDNAIKLTCGIYNGILSLYVDSSDPDSEDLKSIGFIDVPPMWELYIKNKAYGENALAALKKDFKIPNTNEAEIHLILDSMKRNRYPHDFPKNVRNWLKIENKPEKDKKLLHIYPAVIDEDVFFVVNTKTNTSLNLTKYKFDKVDRYYIYFSKSDADFKRKAKEAKKILTITNWDEFVEDCKDTFNIKI